MQYCKEVAYCLAIRIIFNSSQDIRVYLLTIIKIYKLLSCYRQVLAMPNILRNGAYHRINIGRYSKNM